MSLSTIVLREPDPAGPAQPPPARRPIILLAVAASPLEGDRVRATLAASPLTNLVHSVTGVREMSDYLLRRGRYSILARSRLPGIILLDEEALHNGARAALDSLREHRAIGETPLLLLTADGVPEAPIPEGWPVRSFVRKPLTFEGLMEAVLRLAPFRLERLDINP
ncbi:MAG: hypothetical protein HYY93_09825 [Planctomycetes bacterium]|nr:hypothetical protein [Planctomycetota bacterium]